jgi:hypothetical protein
MTKLKISQRIGADLRVHRYKPSFLQESLPEGPILLSRHRNYVN